ncbi:phytoene desaturase family protein [Pontixanthobacter aestiaquae]|uniref:Phytoene desaturase n=1 Tax=Pontixanthobacter aestiaquae TaxID=1509367 RepID=A0A844ZAW4_9SPHN|nr:1-hydroxycarotenoid 3,4-desaturase CrtD [Pontixanthobacter aestiaquae]MDN3644760.1 phytoene desaturase family protein [Pontixanthobacter aestiaquae]MXO84233.1 phytoene desaturase [Pontixanthobacter aestiaquae]
MAETPTVIIGAGIGGLTSAALLSAQGVPVTVLEKEAMSGGKIRQLDVDGSPIDAGPTVFTMRSVIDAIFESAGASTDHYLTLTKADTLARHAWDRAGYLDLFADHEKSVDAVGQFAGAKAAQGFRSFSAEAKHIFDILDEPMLRGSKVSWPVPLMRRIGLSRIGAMLAIRPYESLWKVLGEHFDDVRLRQLFGRYTTYCGSSPFHTPATLMLIAHVEAQGVWSIRGGMSALSSALEAVARKNGARFRFGAHVDEIRTDRKGVRAVHLESGETITTRAVICNADPAALAAGQFGRETARAARIMKSKSRSLSAMVWLAKSKASGFALDHHNVFFSGDYPAEFAEIKSGHPPQNPTAYVCALDHDTGAQSDTAQRYQIIVNAPANGDTHEYSAEEKDQCTSNMLKRLSACGLELETPLRHELVTPNDFSQLFPATGGALYGRASHGWAASFLRPGCRTKIRGLYCTGGATHPGAGVPMAALSGKLASEAVLSDRISTRWYHRKDTAGGMSMPSAMTEATG